MTHRIRNRDMTGPKESIKSGKHKESFLCLFSSHLLHPSPWLPSFPSPPFSLPQYLSLLSLFCFSDAYSLSNMVASQFLSLYVVGPATSESPFKSGMVRSQRPSVSKCLLEVTLLDVGLLLEKGTCMPRGI